MNPGIYSPAGKGGGQEEDEGLIFSGYKNKLSKDETLRHRRV